MTSGDFLQSAAKLLSESGVSTARLDTLVLLEDATGRDRAHLLAHPETELSAEQIKVLNKQISQRTKHVPLAYIRGKTEFYGREFSVSEYVLEPRPESETMIELLKKCAKQAGFEGGKGLILVDVGTGSGALAITAKLELSQSEVMAIDIDPNCLELTKKNAKNLNAAITVAEGDLLSPLAHRQPMQKKPEAYVLLCNLPYVPDGFHINQAATHEPRLAIFGGPDGLDPYRALFGQIDQIHTKPLFVLTESLPPQHPEVAVIAEEHGYKQLDEDDFIQLFVPR